MELTQALAQLEAAAAAVGHLLQEADEELLAEVAGAWSPLRPRGYQQRRWDVYWLQWLRECAERLPVGEAADQPSGQN